MKQITKVRKIVCTMADQLRKAGYSLKEYSFVRCLYVIDWQQVCVYCHVP